MATGARSVLIAFNINLNTHDKTLANSIAGKIRTSGVLKKDESGNKILDKNGKPERIKGMFSDILWLAEEVMVILSREGRRWY